MCLFNTDGSHCHFLTHTHTHTHTHTQQILKADRDFNMAVLQDRINNDNLQKEAAKQDVEAQLAAACKDNAILLQRLKETVEECEGVHVRVSAAEGKVQEYEEEMQAVLRPKIEGLEKEVGEGEVALEEARKELQMKVGVCVCMCVCVWRNGKLLGERRRPSIMFTYMQTDSYSHIYTHTHKKHSKPNSPPPSPTSRPSSPTHAPKPKKTQPASAPRSTRPTGGSNPCKKRKRRRRSSWRI